MLQQYPRPQGPRRVVLVADDEREFRHGVHLAIIAPRVQEHTASALRRSNAQIAQGSAWNRATREMRALGHGIDVTAAE